jgi:hypothetical protein
MQGVRFGKAAALPQIHIFTYSRQLKRNLDDPARHGFICGQHVSVFPAEVMPWDLFQATLLEFINKSDACREKQKKSREAASLATADIDKCGEELLSVERDCSLREVFSPGRTSDAILQEAANVLYEMAQDPLTDPNRAFRALYFHYLLCEEEADCENLFAGDALTSFLQEALDICEDAPTTDSEDLRDYIRLTIAEQLDWNPKLRSHDSEDQLDTLRAFGDNPVSVSTTQDEVQEDISASRLLEFLVRLMAAGQVDDFQNRMKDGSISKEYWNSLPAVDLNCVSNKFLDKVELLGGASRIELKARSVAIVAVGLPSSDARELKNWMNSCSDEANLLLMAVAFVSDNVKCGRNCEILRADTDAALMRSCPEYFRSATAASVGTAKLQIKALRITGINGDSRVKAFASALSKCINNFYSHMWDCTGRVVVRCASGSLSHDLEKVSAPTKLPEYRNHVVSSLISSLSDNDLLSPYVNITAAQLGPVPLNENSQVLVLFSFGHNTHQSACDLTYKVLRQKGMSFADVADICVDVDGL